MCMFPKICVIYQQTESLSSLLVVFVALDMRTSFLLFILTAAKHTFTGVYAGPSMPVSSTVRCEAPEPPKNAKTPDKLESRFRMQCIDGYVRKAGTSNLYRCEEKNHAYLWVNLPSLTCIPDPLKPIPTAGPTSTALTNTQAHTPAPNLTLSTSSAPVTTYYTTKGKTQSTSTTSEVDGESKAPVSDPTKNGIAAGTVLILIVAVASAVGVFLWCRRSRKRELNPAEEMISPAPSSDKPLLELATSTSFSDSVQNPDSLPTLIVQHA
ncbi:interleukin-15 receptor subunit alpha isoform X5 [Pygocentrus nattereri]|uniref:interleukin-15 receptor subunit alpha isoform X5 n=1 Tax=Pygocentrus nattereri TaxID=42514 RepID=UPI0008143F38|nr:interleukin-15 receptor subunit alpha isoform X5 [Pygocentrus nattereri]